MPDHVPMKTILSRVGSLHATFKKVVAIKHNTTVDDLPHKTWQGEKDAMHHSMDKIPNRPSTHQALLEAYSNKDTDTLWSVWSDAVAHAMKKHIQHQATTTYGSAFKVKGIGTTSTKEVPVFPKETNDEARLQVVQQNDKYLQHLNKHVARIANIKGIINKYLNTISTTDCHSELSSIWTSFCQGFRNHTQDLHNTWRE